MADQGVSSTNSRAKYSDQKPLIPDLMEWSDPSYLLTDLFDVDEDFLLATKQILLTLSIQ